MPLWTNRAAPEFPGLWSSLQSAAPEVVETSPIAAPSRLAEFGNEHRAWSRRARRRDETDPHRGRAPRAARPAPGGRRHPAGRRRRPPPHPGRRRRAAHGRRARGGRRRSPEVAAGTRRPSLQGLRLGGKPDLPAGAPGLSGRKRRGQRHGRPPRNGPQERGAGPLRRRAGRRRASSDQQPARQPGGDADRRSDQGGEPGQGRQGTRRGRAHQRGHAEDRRHPPVPPRRDHRYVARGGGAADRGPGAHPVPAGDPDRRLGADRVRPARDQPPLHPRSRPQPQPGGVSREPGPPGVHHQLAQPDGRAPRLEPRHLCGRLPRGDHDRRNHRRQPRCPCRRRLRRRCHRRGPGRPPRRNRRAADPGADILRHRPRHGRPRRWLPCSSRSGRRRWPCRAPSGRGSCRAGS